MAEAPRVCALILAGGSGRRAGEAKQFARASGRSLLYHACLPFLRSDAVDGVVVVVPAGRGPEVTEELDDMFAAKLLGVVRGGETRHASSRAGLAALPASCETVLIHDAARPFASEELVARLVAAAHEHGAVVPVIPVADSTIELDGDGALRSYLVRDHLRAVQTPQGFDRARLEQAFERVEAADHPDDAGLVLADGGTVAVVAGEESNWKVTSPAQLEEAVAILEARGPVTGEGTER